MMASQLEGNTPKKAVVIVVLSRELNPDANIEMDEGEVRGKLESVFKGWSVEAVRVEKV